MPAVQRTGGRFRSGIAADPGRTRRRLLCDERLEALDDSGRRDRLGDPPGTDLGRRPATEGHLLLPPGHDHPRHQGSPDHRDDRGPTLQRDVPDRRPHPCRAPRGGGERGLAPGQGDAGQRAGLALGGRCALGSRARRRHGAGPDQEVRLRRRRAAPAHRRPVHGDGDPAAPEPADHERQGGRHRPGAAVVGTQGHRRRARPEGHVASEGPRGPIDHAGRALPVRGT